MEIDIIDLTDPTYAGMTPEMLEMVRKAQKKKNALVAEAYAAKKSLFWKMLKNNVVYSVSREYEEKAIDKRTEKEIAVVKGELDEALSKAGLAFEGNEYGPFRYPDNPNYNLTESQRFLVVRQYYMDLTSDPKARFQIFQEDEFARTYLGNFYRTLYDLLASYCK